MDHMRIYIYGILHFSVARDATNVMNKKKKDATNETGLGLSRSFFGYHDPMSLLAKTLTTTRLMHKRYLGGLDSGNISFHHGFLGYLKEALTAKYGLPR
jgi:predicted ATP-grasp superfamily ATP-dependent carboligase